MEMISILRDWINRDDSVPILQLSNFNRLRYDGNALGGTVAMSQLLNSTVVSCEKLPESVK